MRALSFWAKHHPISARILIVVSRCLLLWIASFLGTEILRANMTISPLWICFFMMLFLVTCLVYPSNVSAVNYARRKRCDLVVCVSGFVMALCLLVQLQTPFYSTARASLPADTASYKYPEAQKLLAQFNSGEKTDFSRKEKRIVRREFNYQLLRYAKAKLTGNKEESGNAGLIILACIAAVGLFFLVLSLACTLSCNGSDAAAIVVALLGTAGIIWGLVAVIRNIKRKKNQPATQNQ